MAVDNSGKSPPAYPHIVKNSEANNGDAFIIGTSVRVWNIVEFFYVAGMSVEDILLHLKTVTPAQVFCALAYYHDHKEEVDRIRFEKRRQFWVQNNNYTVV